MQNSGRRENSGSVLVTFAGGKVLFSDELRARLRAGWRCVRFEYCVSALIATVRRQSAVYLTATWEDRYIRGVGYCLLAMLLGPWGIPWGLIWTPRAVWVNLTGGVDVTEEVLAGFAEGAESPNG